MNTLVGRIGDEETNILDDHEKINSIVHWVFVCYR